MFEKEAKEYGDNYVKSKYMETVDETWRKGAEFGYNKANEWHYVKDGDYPKDNKPVLCILGDFDSGSYEVGYYNDVGSGESWHFETYHLPDYSEEYWGVSAWKKITGPEVK